MNIKTIQSKLEKNHGIFIHLEYLKDILKLVPEVENDNDDVASYEDVSFILDAQDNLTGLKLVYIDKSGETIEKKAMIKESTPHPVLIDGAPYIGIENGPVLPTETLDLKYYYNAQTGALDIPITQPYDARSFNANFEMAAPINIIIYATNGKSKKNIIYQQFLEPKLWAVNEPVKNQGHIAQYVLHCVVDTDEFTDDITGTINLVTQGVMFNPKTPNYYYRNYNVKLERRHD